MNSTNGFLLVFSSERKILGRLGPFPTFLHIMWPQYFLGVCLANFGRAGSHLHRGSNFCNSCFPFWGWLVDVCPSTNSVLWKLGEFCSAAFRGGRGPQQPGRPPRGERRAPHHTQASSWLQPTRGRATGWGNRHREFFRWNYGTIMWHCSTSLIHPQQPPPNNCNKARPYLKLWKRDDRVQFRWIPGWMGGTEHGICILLLLILIFFAPPSPMLCFIMIKCRSWQTGVMSM